MKWITYSKNEAKLSVPHGFKIKTHWPDFFAETKKGYSTIAIDGNASPASFGILFDSYKREPESNEGLAVKKIVSESCEFPLSGWKRVLEFVPLPKGETNWSWMLFGTTASGRIVQIHCNSSGSFEEKEPFWEIIFSSIRFDN